MNYKEIYKKDDLSGAYLFYGNEKLLMNNTCDYLIKKFTKESVRSFNLTYLKGDDCRISDLISATETYPLSDKKKIVILKDTLNFLNTNELNNEFYKFLDRLPTFIILLFLERDPIGKLGKFYKYFNKKGTNIEFSKLSMVETTRFVNSYFLRKNKKIRPAQVSYFLSLTTYCQKNSNLTLFDLKNEMDKIIGLSKGEYIQNEDIDSLVNRTVEANIFKLLDSLYMKNTEEALVELNNLYKDNEPMQRIFVMIIRQVRMLIAFKVLKNKNASDNDIMNKLSIKNFEFSKIKAYEKNFKIESLKDFYEELLKTDKILKTSNIDGLLELENLIVKYTKT